MRRSKVLDSFSNSLCGVCHDVDIELHFQPLQGGKLALN